MEERKVKVKPNHNSSLNHLPLPLNKKNSMKMQIITTTTRITEVTIEAIDPTGANIVVGSNIEDDNYYRPCGHGKGNYRGHNNYQYHQYYMHDDGSQFKQYGSPCTLCGGFNHSPKHCFKGEHDINNLMEKMSLGSSNQHQNGLYQ